MQDTSDIGSTFQRSWTLLMQNLIVVVPGLIAGGVAVLLIMLFVALFVGAAFVASANSSAGVASLVTLAVLTVVTFMVLGIAQTAYTTGMAGAAWQTGRATFADGAAAFKHRGGEIFLASILMLGIGLVAIVLAPVTLLLSILAYIVFFIYVMPSVILGGHKATAAIADSWRLATRNFGPTLGIAALVICLSLIGAGIAGEMGRLQPVVGTLIGAAVQQAAVAYGTLLVVGEYFKLEPPPASP